MLPDRLKPPHEITAYVISAYIALVGYRTRAKLGATIYRSYAAQVHEHGFADRFGHQRPYLIDPP